MSEQNPIQGLQFAAQLAPQAVNAPVEANGIASSEFRKVLLEQGFSISNRGSPGIPGLPEGAEAGSATGLPQVLTAFLASGNVLPQGGSNVQQAGNSARQPLSGFNAQVNNQALLGESPSLTIKSQELAAGQVLLAGEKESQAPQLMPLSTAARNLSSSLLQSSSQPDTPLQPSPVISSLSDEPADVEKLMQNLLQGQQTGGKLEGQADAARTAQAQQQAVTTQVQPQGNIVTYTPVSQPANIPPPAEAGLLSTAQPAQVVNIDVPVQSADWSRAFAERAVMLVNNQQSAQLRVTPASLGQIDIQVRVKDDEASIIINTQNNFVKETVESSLPRLRDMLESQGLNLVDVNVNERQTDKQNDFASAFDHQDADDSEEQADSSLNAADMRPMMYVRSDAVDMYV